MKLHRIVFVLTLLPLGLEVACGGDDEPKKVYILPEGGTTPDNGGVFCEPANVPEAKFDPPSPLNQKVCTDRDIALVITSCGIGETANSADCADAKSQLAACASCIIGAESDPVAHPSYQYDPDTIALASPSACMLAMAQNDEQRDCAKAYGQIETCSLASCLGPCLDDKNKDHFSACLTSALSSVCTKGTDVYSTPVCQQHYDGTTFGFCTSFTDSKGQQLADPDYFFAIAKLYCGGLEEPDAGADAGPKDAGEDG